MTDAGTLLVAHMDLGKAAEYSLAGKELWSAPVPGGLVFDQLFADGTKMIRARYPNFDPGEVHFGGVARDASTRRCHPSEPGASLPGSPV